MILPCSISTSQFPKPTFQFLLLSIIVSYAFYLQIVLSVTPKPHYVISYCRNTTNTYIPGSPFHLLLNDTLLSKLPKKASKTNYSTFTNGTGVDQVNALYYCRGSMSTLFCHDCVIASVDKIMHQCEFMKDAVVYYEECTLRYSNKDIFYIDEVSPVYTYPNNTGIMNDDFLDPFKDEFDKAVDGLVQETAYSTKLKGFAITDVVISSTEVLHCVMQCSPDIVGVYCERCLKSALNQRDRWADTMIFMPSCFLRVDLFRSAGPSLLTTSPPSSPGKKWIKIVIIVGVIIIISVAILVVVYYLRKRAVIAGIGDLRVFKYAELSAATDRFNKTNYLGKGGFGEVHRGRTREGVDIAVKRLMKGTYHGKLEFLSEMRNNSCARNVNVISLLGYCSEGKHRMLVYEFMPRKCLHKNLHGRDATPEELNSAIRLKIALGTAKGLKYLHEDCLPKIGHRDVKSANILLDLNFEAKVADFGLAKIFPDDVSFVFTEVKGTLSYLDPDYSNTKKLTKKSDVYSFGIVLMELITGWTSTCLLDSGRTTNLLRAITDCRFGDLIDSKLKKDGDDVNHNDELMIRMIICAALCLHPFAKCRLKMSQVVKLLEVGRLDADDVIDIVAYAKNDLGTSTASTSRPATYQLENLQRLAIQVHEKGNRLAAQQQIALTSGLSYERSNATTEYQSMESSMELQDL